MTARIIGRRKTLVKMCMGNMIVEYRAVLKNLEIS